MEFPLFNTKELGSGKVYNLNDPVERKKYFQEKCGTKIEEIKEAIDKDGFLGIMLAKKSAGKGTYSKMFAEIVGEERVSHISVGDIVRDIHALISKDDPKKKEIMDYLKKNYRGFISLDEALDAFVNKTQSKLIPTEFILTLVKMEVEKANTPVILLDGFPRNLDQISYSLYFREIMKLTVGPDFFVLIDVPVNVIDERMKYRLICPECHTSRNTKLLPTSNVFWDSKNNEYGLICDNPDCDGAGKAVMIRKEGDEDGIEPIRKRLETDGELMQKASELHGVEKVLIRNSIPVDKAMDVADEYELTPEFYYEGGKDGSNVKTLTKPWEVEDDTGVMSHSVMAPMGVVSMIHQIHSILTTGKNKYNK